MMKMVADHTSACCMPRKMFDVATVHQLSANITIKGMGMAQHHPMTRVHFLPKVSQQTPVTKLKMAFTTPKKTRFAVVMVNFSWTKTKTSAFSLQSVVVSIHAVGW